MKEEILSELREKMNNTAKALKKDFMRIRTGIFLTPCSCSMKPSWPLTT